jgi:hypothetical protein
MPTTLEAAITKFLHDRRPARGTQDEYSTTLKKWSQWGGGVPIEELGRQKIREFLDWVYEDAVTQQGRNPGRTANKAREHLRAITSWAQEQGLVASIPPIPKARQQRDVAGRHSTIGLTTRMRPPTLRSRIAELASVTMTERTKRTSRSAVLTARGEVSEFCSQDLKSQSNTPL